MWRIAAAAGLFSLTASAAIAAGKDLQQVRSSPNGTVYIDRATLERQPERAIVWTLWDHPADQLNLFEEPYRSARLRSEYNCTKRTVRLLEIVEYTGQLASGEPIRTYPAFDSEARTVPPGSVGDAVLSEVCASPERVRDF